MTKFSASLAICASVSRVRHLRRKWRNRRVPWWPDHLSKRAQRGARIVRCDRMSPTPPGPVSPAARMTSRSPRSSQQVRADDERMEACRIASRSESPHDVGEIWRAGARIASLRASDAANKRAHGRIFKGGHFQLRTSGGLQKRIRRLPNPRLACACHERNCCEVPHRIAPSEAPPGRGWRDCEAESSARASFARKWLGYCARKSVKNCRLFSDLLARASLRAR